ncbi:MAG TPA: glycine cleavage system protein H [Candidatus Korarchaeota archaeon]|nr:glycine cleavage system protein H [Candidatus Korarchaeota archaeon]
MDQVPRDRKYTKTHEWAKLEDGRVKVGLTKHAIDSLGDLTYVEVKSIGTEVEKGGELGLVESNKAVEHIYAPVSGRVVELNSEAGVIEEGGTEITGELEVISEDPYGQGWIVILEPTKLEEEWDQLLSPEEYEKLLAEEG